MRRSRELSGTSGNSGFSAGAGGRLAMLLSLVLVAAVSGCGASSIPKNLYSNTVNGSIIVPGVIAVSAAGSGLDTSTSTSTPVDIQEAVCKVLNSLGTGLTVRTYTEDENSNSGGDDTPTVTDYHNSTCGAESPSSWLPFTGGTIDSGVEFFQLQKQGGDDNADADLTAAINAVNLNLAGMPLNGNTSVEITGASPDWMMVDGAASNPISAVTAGSGYTGGSPDGPPTPDANAKENGGSPTSPPGQCSPTRRAGRVGNPTVYVLDTGYPVTQAGEMVPIAACICQNVAPCPTLLDDLASGLPVLEDYEPLTALANYYTEWQSESWFTSHGLAVAELIHHLAPNAQVIMRTVLNDNGVGDLYTLLQVLQSVWNDPLSTAAATVINMSLTVEPPLACLSSIWSGGYAQFANHYQIRRGECTFAPTVNRSGHRYDSEYLMAPLLDVIGTMVVQGYHIVAATGNDSQTSGEGEPPYGADLPAALCGVVAAAATTSAAGPNWKTMANLSLAHFSNQPSDPFLGLGINCLSLPAPFQTATGITSPEYSPAYALGVNVCSIDYVANDNSSGPGATGLWSGTSFATALVSGNLAAAISPSASGNIPNPYDVVSNLQDASQYQPCSSSDAGTGN